MNSDVRNSRVKLHKIMPPKEIIAKIASLVSITREVTHSMKRSINQIAPSQFSQLHVQILVRCVGKMAGIHRIKITA